MLKSIKFKLKKVIRSTPLVIVLILSVIAFNFTYSSTLDNMSGYGWGADWIDLNSNGLQDLPNETSGGMGWLSFNCVNEDGTCVVGDNYGVNIDSITKNISGYAWSNNYGWLKFGGLSNFPTGGGTSPTNAKFTGTVLNGNFNGSISGWARFCAPSANPDSCSGFVINDQNGGWDGWVSLSGSTPNYGITVTNNILSGFAWGGNDNDKNIIGWIDLSGVVIGDNQAYLDFYALPSPVFAPNVTTQLRWNALNGVTFTSCIADSDTVNPTHPNPSLVTGWGGLQSSVTPAVLTVNLLEGVYNPTYYKITCIDTLGTSHSRTIAVPKITEESLTLRNDRVITNAGVSKTVLRWTAVNIAPDSCIASTVNPDSGMNWTTNNPKIPPTIGSPSPVSGIMTDVIVTAVLPEKTTYRLICTGAFSGLPINAFLDLHTTSGSSSARQVPIYQEN
jgi:hypothetical protein